MILGCPGEAFAQSPAPELSRQVEIVRTEHGVPHIRAKNLRAAGYGLGWVMTEDYGARTPHGLLRARGEMGRVFGRDSMDGDFINRIRHERAVLSYYRLEKATRDVYEGFAAGVNGYIEQHREEFATGLPSNFTGIDVAARDIGGGDARAQRFLARVDPKFRRDTTQEPVDANPASALTQLTFYWLPYGPTPGLSDADRDVPLAAELLARGDHLAGVGLDPARPLGPPAAGFLLRAGEPLVGMFRVDRDAQPLARRVIGIGLCQFHGRLKACKRQPRPRNV